MVREIWFFLSKVTLVTRWGGDCQGTEWTWVDLKVKAQEKGGVIIRVLALKVKIKGQS